MKLIKSLALTSLMGFLAVCLIVLLYAHKNTTAQPNELAEPAVAPSIGATIVVAPTASACIVTISGNRYDVSILKSTHTGGDIFNCGTDMTALFFGQHNQALLNGQMVKYLLLN